MNLLDYFLNNERGNMIHKPMSYFPVYEKYFFPLRDRKIKVLEIGVENGGSLQMWRQYFHPDSEIIGIDINPACRQFEQPGIRIHIGDQSDMHFLRSVIDQEKEFDIIIDDGGHHVYHQIISFEILYPHTKSIYLCEDTGTSYQSIYGGGLKRHGTFIEMSKSLVDQLYSFESSEIQKTYFSLNTLGIYFYRSIVVFEKGIQLSPDTRAIGIKKI